MHDMAKLARRTVLLVAALTALAAAPAAHAGLQVSMSGSGLSVTTNAPNDVDVIQITGRLTPENAIGNWDVNPLCLTADLFGGAGCVDTHDADCNVLSGGLR